MKAKRKIDDILQSDIFLLEIRAHGHYDAILQKSSLASKSQKLNTGIFRILIDKIQSRSPTFEQKMQVLPSDRYPLRGWVAYGYFHAGIQLLLSFKLLFMDLLLSPFHQLLRVSLSVEKRKNVRKIRPLSDEKCT